MLNHDFLLRPRPIGSDAFAIAGLRNTRENRFRHRRGKIDIVVAWSVDNFDPAILDNGVYRINHARVGEGDLLIETEVIAHSAIGEGQEPTIEHIAGNHNFIESFR